MQATNTSGRTPTIEGWIKLKRKAFWAKRYAEVVNNLFCYYKNKGDAIPRMALSLKGSSIKTKADGSDSLELLIETTDSVTKEKELIQLRFENDEEKMQWLRALQTARKGSANLSRVETEPAEEPEQTSILRAPTGVQSANNSVISKRSILPERDNVRMIDQELLDDNFGADLQTMKANLYHFKFEAAQNSILVHSSGSLRVFRSMNQKKAESNAHLTKLKDALQSVKALMENILDFQKANGTFVFSIFFVMAAVLLFTSLYVFLNFIELLTFTTSAILLANLVLFFGNLFLVRLNIESLTENQRLTLWGKPGDYRYKSITTIEADVNQIIFILKQINCRKNWFPYCIEGKINDSVYIMRFLLDNNEKVEKFRISTIQEGEKLYILDHIDMEILRLFEITLNQDEEFHVLSLYTRSKSSSIANIEDPWRSPLILDCFQAYLRETNADPRSIVRQYLAQSKRAVMDITYKIENAYIPNERLSIQSNQEKSLDRVVRRESVEEAKEEVKVQEPPQSKVVEETKEVNITSSKESKPASDVPDDPKLKEYWDITGKALEDGLKLYDLKPENNWSLDTTLKDGTVHFRSDPGSKLVWLRSEFTLKANPWDCYQTIQDFNLKKEYDASFEQGSIVEKMTETMALIHLKFKGQLTVESRDFSLITRWEKKSENLMYISATSIVHPKLPEWKKTTRAQCIVAFWRLEQIEPGVTKGCYLTAADLKGSIPQSIVKMAVKKSALAVEEMRKFIEKGKHKK